MLSLSISLPPSLPSSLRVSSLVYVSMYLCVSVSMRLCVHARSWVQQELSAMPIALPLIKPPAVLEWDKTVERDTLARAPTSRRAGALVDPRLSCAGLLRRVQRAGLLGGINPLPGDRELVLGVARAWGEAPREGAGRGRGVGGMKERLEEMQDVTGAGV